MSEDQAIRAVVIGAFLLMLPIAVYHRFRSQRTREHLDRRQEGTFILATLRPVGLVCWTAVFAWMIDPDWIAWSSMPVPRSARWVGAGLFVAGCGLLLWTFRSLGLNLTDTVVTRRAHTLVVHGPYRWIRHPLYDAVLLMTGGVALAAATWFVLATGLAVFGLLALRTRIEERKLVERFGDDYREYMRRTGRYLPRRRSG